MAHSIFCEQGARKTCSAVSAGVVPPFSAFVLLLTLAAAACGGTVNCNNNSGDPTLLQNAIHATAAGGTLTIGGTCNMGGSEVSASGITINGNATFNGNSSNYILNVGANTTVTGLTFNGGGIIIQSGASSSTITQHVTISNNTIGNIASANLGCISAGGILQHSLIANNVCKHVWDQGWPSLSSNPTNTNDWVSGFLIFGGMDDTTITGNNISWINGDGMHIGFNGMFGNTSPFTGHNVVVSNNEFSHVHRISLEMQGAFNYPSSCPGGCNASNIFVDGILISGNYSHDTEWPYWVTWNFSLPLDWSTNGKWINNTAIVSDTAARTCAGFFPNAYEVGASALLFQGNVAMSGTLHASCTPWNPYITEAGGSGTSIFQNGIVCGPGVNTTINTENPAHATIVDQYNFKSSSACPSNSNLTASTINLAFTSPNNQSFPSGGNGTWSNYVISNLSIRQMQFFIDGSPTPAVTQQIQDVNTNFASDRKWLYHATLTTPGNGNHTITAKATDVSGATQSVTQNFTVGSGGGGGTPKAQVTPTSLSFGSQTLGIRTGAQTATLSNTGSAALAISSLSLGGANPSDFSQTSNCGNSLGAAASCIMTVAFTPSATGSRTATLSISDNDSGSPQTVSLSGTGTNPSGGTPKAQVTPASLAFGSQPLGVNTGAQTATLSNTGTAALSISNISLVGPNTSDFSQASSCGGLLGAGGSCTMTVTFTPSRTGPRIATLSISDNDSGSPQTISLSGTGTNPSGGGGLPTNLPTGMILWLANNAGVVTNGNGVSAWDDQSGNGNSAFQPNAANQPTVVYGDGGQNALSFNGSSTFMSIPSLPIDGVTGMSVFLVSANSKEHTESYEGWGNHAFLWWPETGLWGTTYFGSYQTSSHFRFGTGQQGNEPSYPMLFTRTNSFGLSEWAHSGTTDSMWLNGQSVASFGGKLQSMNGVGNTALLGQGANNTFYAGDVSEVIVYSRALSTLERQTIEQYLMKKYHL